MTDATAPVLVYSGSLVDAQRVRSALEAHGVAAWLLNQNFGNWYGISGGVHVHVRAEDRSRALELMAELGLIRSSGVG